ncbi:MAG: hypothetical protein ACOX0W_05240 [Sphaerochaetaceae bacterium]
MFSLRYKKVSDTLSLFRVSSLTRLFFLLFSAVIGIGLASVMRDDSLGYTSLFPLALLIIGLFGSGYIEKWTFDSSLQRITYNFGWFIPFKTEVYEHALIKRIEITHFVKGSHPTDSEAKPRGRNKAFVVFALRFNDDTTKSIEIMPERSSGGKLETAAHLLASQMDLPLFVDREIDRIGPMI